MSPDKHRRLDQLAAGKPEFGYTTAEVDAEVARLLVIFERDKPDIDGLTEAEEIAKYVDLLNREGER
jgi:hypothetical protein